MKTLEQTKQMVSAPAKRNWYRRARESLLQLALRGASQALYLHPRLSLRHHRVQRQSNIPYTSTGLSEHTLDIYKPVDVTGPLPVMLYVHGGGFQLLSKDTHWSIATRYASQGYIVFNINYRLAPEHPYPAALMDTIDACLWAKENAERFGGDPGRVVLAGESAGANLVTSLAVAACYEQSESWAQRFFQEAPSIEAVIAACGILQVSDPDRFHRRRPMPEWIIETLREVAEYLPNKESAIPGQWKLADPLLELEKGLKPARDLPPFLAFVGTRDPLLDDTRRLSKALSNVGASCRTHYYEAGIHAFHALPWGNSTRRCWQDQFHFLRSVSPG